GSPPPEPPPTGPSPIMPVDMAVRICLSGSPPLRSLLAATSLWKPKLLHQLSRRSAAARGGWRKKSVVFADSQGLALTAVHVFDEAENDPLTELQFHLTEIEGATAALHLGGNKDLADCGSGLVLDFTQPAADYLDLRNRLKAQQVCLETLSYLNNVYGCPDTDTFSFSVSVPEHLESSSRVEFCIQYQTEDQIFWDNNHGNNYRLVVAEADGSRSSENTEIQRDHSGEQSQMEFDPFGNLNQLLKPSEVQHQTQLAESWCWTTAAQLGCSHGKDAQRYSFTRIRLMAPWLQMIHTNVCALLKLPKIHDEFKTSRTSHQLDRNLNQLSVETSNMDSSPETLCRKYS
ncbi:hypothetical protein INR49_020199, partial [Caranx melampygus]